MFIPTNTLKTASKWDAIRRSNAGTGAQYGSGSQYQGQDPDKAIKMGAIARSNAGTGTEYGSGSQYMGLDPSEAIETAETMNEVPEWKKSMQKAYGLQRERATAENEAERVRAEERMKGRMASGGFEGGSMLQEKMLGNLDIGSQKALAGRLGQIDIAESAAMGDRDAQFQLAAMNNDFATGRMTLADQLQTTRETNQAVAESYYNRALSGEDIPKSELDALRTSNPSAYSAYMSGKAGLSREEFQRGYDRQTQIYNALIMRLDPMSSTFQRDITNLANSMGIELPEGLLDATPGAASGNDFTGYSDVDFAEEYAKFLNPQERLKNPQRWAAIQLEKLRREAA